MNKQAWSALDPFHMDSVTGYQPSDLFLISALGGAGGFGGMRLLSEMMNKAHPQKAKENAVRLALPDPQHVPVEDFEHQQAPEADMQGTSSMSSMSPKHGQESMPFMPPVMPPMDHGADALSQLGGNAGDGGLKALSVITGLPLGFLGAKFMYDKFKGGQMDKKIDKSRNHYFQQLQGASQQATKTACVDSFCEAVADELNKEANPTPDQIHAFAQSPLMENSMDDIYRAHLFGKARGAADSLGMHAGSLAEQTGMVLGAGGLAATLGSLVWANKKKQEREQKAQYPTRVVYGE
jgi:hypothetical protein